VNPLYTIMEMPHRWLVLAGLAFLAACLVPIVMMAYSWPHLVAQLWFYAGAIVTIYFLVRAFLEWKEVLDAVPLSDDEKR
jgi:uncharacterized membrane protein